MVPSSAVSAGTDARVVSANFDLACRTLTARQTESSMSAPVVSTGRSSWSGSAVASIIAAAGVNAQ